ncbi:MAG: cyclodeaminase/cyclohydrolase family protein [Candidatus Omnitrophota bacterium]
MDYSKVQVSEFLKEVASRKISPGGGSASALAAALGSALNLMVINFGIAPFRSKDELEELEQAKKRQELAMERALHLMNEDCVVFSDLMTAINKKNDTPDKYSAAAEVPLEVCRSARESLEIAAGVLDIVTGHITADIACSKNILVSSFYSAKVNVKMNLSGMGPGEMSEKFIRDLKDLEKSVVVLAEEIDKKLIKFGIVKGDSK